MAPAEYTITAVAEDTERDLWSITYQDVAGTVRHHVFPKNTLEWRAAEYGIDPTDTDTLLDIVLHEPHTPHPDDRLSADDDPAAAAGLMSMAPVSRGTVRAGDLVPTTLYTAETVEQAREAHLLRIQHTKANRVRVSVPKGSKDPFDAIRQRGIDPERVAAMAQHVDRTRRRLRGEQLPDRAGLPIDPGIARRANAHSGKNEEADHA
ncbi:hypothetical protein [Streptomyces malaysiensis]|uniref:Uncharacterized protein n=1 Tax=Streptomyces malaysiensis subsp. samsunensis TaxID=459658 RepID=A0A9X2LXF9_STRMQ|nr:hypothetical protein [Streptomyces samsunensis]MCQ8831751.1 hypothetical protein [Streptomyces samsunensis]